MSTVRRAVSIRLRITLILLLSALFASTTVAAEGPAPKAAFDVNAMGDMSDFDPAHPIIPTGDTIKIAIVASFSGPAALSGQVFWATAGWAVHDINKRGGLFVDGKKKLVQLIKADHMSKPDACKKVCERMVLQEKVHVLWGTDGGHLQKIINETASKYKVISLNAATMLDEVQDATHFSRYTFMAFWQTDQAGRAFAYYYGKIRKKERKFYILCQDYSFGHALADAFKRGLKEFHPDAEIVGEDYHKLFLTDFAPYLTKVKASGAEVIFTGDWMPDAANLLKQSRQMGITLPFAEIFMGEPNVLHEVGVDGTKGMVELSSWFNEPPAFKTPEHIKYYRTWNDLWKTKWKTPPYDSRLFQHGGSNLSVWTGLTYWLLSVIERARSTDPEKIIAVWEGDSYRFVNGKVVRMRSCDHKVVQDLAAIEYVEPARQKEEMNVPPHVWFEGTSSYGRPVVIPARHVLPLMDEKLERCKGKSLSGE